MRGRPSSPLLAVPALGARRALVRYALLWIAGAVAVALVAVALMDLIA